MTTQPGRPTGKLGEAARIEGTSERTGDTTADKPPSEAARTGIEPPQGSGFAARLQDATLWDLVQFECLRRSRRSVRITSRGMVGFVHFRDGNVVHASTARQAGGAALREMLEWKDGIYETWGGAAPDRDTITTPWQSLLLEAAQARDEAVAPNVLSFPARESAEPKGEEALAPPPPPAAAPRPELPTVIMAPDGSILRGASVPDLPEAAAYSAQLAELIGEFLGMEAFRALEVSFEHAHFLVARATDGRLVAAKAGQPAELDPLRRELGL
jgi:hypothetical protein